MAVVSARGRGLRLDPALEILMQSKWPIARAKEANPDLGKFDGAALDGARLEQPSPETAAQSASKLVGVDGASYVLFHNRGRSGNLRLVCICKRLRRLGAQSMTNELSFDAFEKEWLVEIQVGRPSALTQTEDAGSSLSFSKMAFAGLVQTKGFAALLCSLM